MRYQINYNELMKEFEKAKTEKEAIIATKEAIRAIFYFLKIVKLEINEELYSKIDDSGKKYFIGLV